MMVTSLHPGISREQVVEATGWPMQFAEEVTETVPPGKDELEVLRDLLARTAKAHGSDGGHE